MHRPSYNSTAVTGRGPAPWLVHRALQWVLLLTFAALSACARPQAPAAYVTPWKLTGAETVTVSARTDKSNLKFIQPRSGRGGGALYGAGAAAMGAMEMGTGCEGIGCGLIIPIALGAAVVGGAVGAATSHSEQETKAATAALIAALKEADPGRDLEAHVVGKGPVAPKGPKLRRGTSGRTLLRLKVQIHLGLTGSRIDPDVITALYVTGTLRNGSGAPVTVTWSHRSAPYSYFRLAENDGKLMRDVIRAEAAEVARLIRSEMYMAANREAPRP